VHGRFAGVFLSCVGHATCAHPPSIPTMSQLLGCFALVIMYGVGLFTDSVLFRGRHKKHRIASSSTSRYGAAPGQRHRMSPQRLFKKPSHRSVQNIIIFSTSLLSNELLELHKHQQCMCY
jgi:hypothetical protein